ncbi:MAG: thioether cross-link-forming SCIFF peptide maturase [Eubacteriales bacterium]|nr:thioether cross-link-forming SCIFF peptide maturase [Eubacteriales bacterium]
MIHCFESMGLKLALDVGSGAVHLLDDPSYYALQLWDSLDKDEITTRLSEKYGSEVASDTMQELLQLEKDEMIDASDTYSDEEIKHDGPPVVKAMCLLAAHDCNMRCKYCFADTGEFQMGERKLLSAETGKKALDWLVKMSGNRKNLEVDFFGGEPLMNFKAVKEIVAYGRELEKKHNKKFKFTITTNGLAITNDVIDFVNKEMDNVVLSIDGRKEVHDFMRPGINGKSCYDLVLKNVKKLVEARKQQNYYVRGTYTKFNKDFCKDIFLLADEGFEQISVEPVVAPESEPYALTEADLEDLYKEYDKVAEKYLERRKNGKWFSFFHYNIDLAGGPCIKKRLNGCGVGNEYVAVAADGTIYPCHQFVGKEEFKMGSVLDESFDSYMQSVFANNNVLHKKKCVDCWAKFHCSGGCTANAYSFNKNITMPHEFECLIERKRLENAIAIYVHEQIDE